MLERIFSVVMLILVLTTYMNPSSARKNFFPLASRKVPKNSHNEGMRRNYSADFYIGASAESIGHGDGSYPMDAVFRDAMDSGLDSSNFGLFEMPEKFKYFREANDVLTNRVLPAGKPRAYRGQYSKSDRKVVIKL